MKKKFLLPVVLLLLAAGWCWRYAAVNARYRQQYPPNAVEVYGIGQAVPFGDDFIDYESTGEGYSLRADGYEVISMEEAMERWPQSRDMELVDAEKLVIVHVTLFNESGEGGIILTDLDMHATSVPMFMEWNLLTAANPVLEGNNGIILAPGTSYQLELPFSLVSRHFGGISWRNIEDRTFYLQLTAYPTIKEIALCR